MLVLTRKKGERIRISDSVTVVVVDLGGDRVRLGFEAPAEVAIFREELEPRTRETATRGKDTTGPEAIVWDLPF